VKGTGFSPYISQSGKEGALALREMPITRSPSTPEASSPPCSSSSTLTSTTSRATILVPVDFDDRETLAALLTERTGHRIEIAVPQRGEKRSLVDLASQNAKQSYTQRFRRT